MKEVFEKIIEQLKIEIKRWEDSGTEYKDKCEIAVGRGLRKAIEIVKKEAEKYNNGWIPYSEPPKTGEYVLLSFKIFSVPMVGRYEENEQGGAYYIRDEDEACIKQGIFVNAWQPLPAPYQPKGE